MKRSSTKTSSVSDTVSPPWLDGPVRHGSLGSDTCVRLFPSWCAATNVLVRRGADQDAATFALADPGIAIRLRVDRERGTAEREGTGSTTHMRC